MAIDTPLYEEIALVIGDSTKPYFGTVLDTWESYQYEKDLFTPSDTFSFRLAIAGKTGKSAPTEAYIQQMMAVTQPDTVVRVLAGRDPLMTGIIGRRQIKGDRGHEYVEISGRDPASLLTDNEVDPKLVINHDTTLPDLANQILAKYRGRGLLLRVFSDNASNRSIITGTSRKPQVSPEYVDTGAGRIRVNYDPATAQAKLADQNLGVSLAKAPAGSPAFFERMTIADARPHPGETEWDFLDRHAKNLGVIPAMSAEGDLIFLKPDYNQHVLYTIRRRINQALSASNNILGGGQDLNYENTATSMHILGRGSLYRSQSSAPKRRTHKKKPKIQSTAVSKMPYIWPRERYIRDASPKSIADALRVANRELAHRNSNAEVYTYDVPGHGLNGVRWGYDTLIQVVDDLIRPTINKVCYITKYAVAGTLGKNAAIRTSLTMVPKGAIIL